jgi:hypothetical protein
MLEVDTLQVWYECAPEPEAEPVYNIDIHFSIIFEYSDYTKNLRKIY